jgi:small subunit ribosomal protein S18
MAEEIVAAGAKPTLDDVFDESRFDEDEGSTGGGHTDNKKKGRRRKIKLNLKCPLCESGVKSVTYKDVYQLKKFTSVRGKIISTEKSGVCSKHQRQLASSIKRARFMALLPFSASDHLTQ